MGRYLDYGEVGDSGVALLVVDDLVLLLGAVWAEEVADGFIVDLEEARLHLELPALFLELLGGHEDLLHGARDNALRLGRRVVRPLHRVCLSGARLPVRKDARVVSVQRRLHQLAHLKRPRQLENEKERERERQRNNVPPRRLRSGWRTG